MELATLNNFWLVWNHCCGEHKNMYIKVCHPNLMCLCKLSMLSSFLWLFSCTVTCVRVGADNDPHLTRWMMDETHKYSSVVQRKLWLLYVKLKDLSEMHSLARFNQDSLLKRNALSFALSFSCLARLIWLSKKPSHVYATHLPYFSTKNVQVFFGELVTRQFAWQWNIKVYHAWQIATEQFIFTRSSAKISHMTFDYLCMSATSFHYLGNYLA